MVERIGQISIDGSQAGVVYGTGGVSPTLIAGTHGYAIGYILVNDMELKLIGEMDNSDGAFEQQNRVYGVEGLAPTITTQAGGGSLQPKFLECRQVGFMDNGTGKHQSNTVWSDEGLSPTITTIDNGDTQQIKAMTNLRIRKLTARECWRLMAFDDEDFEKAAEVNSQTQLYKQAGNSIVVSVLEAIFREML